MTNEDFCKAVRIKREQGQELAPFRISASQRRFLELMGQAQLFEVGIRARHPGRTTYRGWRGAGGAS